MSVLTHAKSNKNIEMRITKSFLEVLVVLSLLEVECSPVHMFFVYTIHVKLFIKKFDIILLFYLIIYMNWSELMAMHFMQQVLQCRTQNSRFQDCWQDGLWFRWVLINSFPNRPDENESRKRIIRYLRWENLEIYIAGINQDVGNELIIIMSLVMMQ